MSEQNTGKGKYGCLVGIFLIVISLSISIFVCQPIMYILGDAAFPIVIIATILLIKLFENMFFKNYFDQ